MKKLHMEVKGSIWPGEGGKDPKGEYFLAPPIKKKPQVQVSQLFLNTRAFPIIQLVWYTTLFLQLSRYLYIYLCTPQTQKPC